MGEMSARCFIGSDWQAVESWLTAYHSGDAVLLKELQAQLSGGPKLHSLNASLIYGIDPKDAKTHQVNLKGRMRDAYDAGKRLSHAWNYGMGPRQGARTFWLSEVFMVGVNEKLTAKYVGVVKWRRTLADRVFGCAVFKCQRCGYVADDDCDCPNCTHEVGVPIPLRFAGYSRQPARVERTVFGRHRLYEGRRANGQNALAAQHPQSCGASMWNVTFARLHGWDPITDQPWPSPEGILRYDPSEPWSELFKATPIFVATGTYDSFYLESPSERRDEVLRWLLWTMEQPWSMLDNWHFPAEGFVGGNLGKHGEGNRNGLRETDTGAPLTMEASSEWR